MYSTLPSLVLAFHGCDRSVFEKVLYEGQDLRPSSNDYDWLGAGVYFWEQNYERGLSWAHEQAKRGIIEDPAVVGAVIDPGFCLNLTDSRYIDLVETEYRLMEAEFLVAGIEMPKNEGRTEDRLFRRLDRAVIEHLHSRIAASAPESDFEPFDSVRGLFSEGRPVYEGAGFRKKTHVQLCVRNPNCIKGYFAPRKYKSGWRRP